MAATGFPLPGTGSVAVAARPAAAGPGNWAGAPSAVLDPAGGFVVAYRTRSSAERGGAVVVARSRDGERLEAVAMVPKSRFVAESLERPAIVRTASGRWRLYVCAATPQSRHWWIAALEADRPAELAQAAPLTVFPGDGRTGVKDPVVRRDADGWRAWICCHPLDVPGAEDRMTTAFATSADGLAWSWHGTALAPRPGAWDARGTRLTTVLPDGRAAHDGRGDPGRELRRADRARAARPGAARRLQGERRRRRRERALPRGRGAVHGRLPPLLRGAAARRQPRAAHGARAGVRVRCSVIALTEIGCAPPITVIS